MVEDIFIKITPGTRSVAMPRSAARKDFRRENDTVENSHRVKALARVTLETET